jgi:membrane protein DedA with SNARE-associated domain
MADISPIKFSSLNVPAAFVWSIAVAGVGYMFAEALESAKGGMEMVHIIALAALCAGLAVFIYKKKSEKKKKSSKKCQ